VVKPRPAEVALVLLLLLLAALFTLRTDDLYWLVQAGRDILSSGHLPTQNRYSFTAPDYPWQTHEWLAEVLAAHASEPALFLCGMLLCWTPIVLVARVSTSWPALAGLSVLVLETGLAGMVLRPYLPGRALLAATLLLRKPPPWWAALFGFALWVNLHGSFGFGLFILAVRAALEDRAWLPALAAGCAGVLLNPYGLQGALFPLRYLGARPFVDYITEWQPLYGTAWAWFALALLPGLVALWLRRRSSDLILLLAFAALACSARRGLPDLALVSAMLLAHAAPPSAPARLRWVLLAAAALPFLGYDRYLQFHERARPAALIAWLHAQPHPPSRIFAEFNWAGSFFELYPRVRVFLDARNDCYPQAIIDAYFTATPRTLDEYGADAAALPPGAPLAGALTARGWREAFKDPQAVLLIRP
jgi:hypothetical protein